MSKSEKFRHNTTVKYKENMLVVYNELGFEEVLLCEPENILSVEEIEEQPRRNFGCYYLKDKPLFFTPPNRSIFKINFVYSIEGKNVSLPNVIILKIFELMDKSENRELSAVVLEYLNSVADNYKRSIILYRNTGVNQRFFTLAKIDEIIKHLESLKVN